MPGGGSPAKTITESTGWEPVMNAIEQDVLPGISEYNAKFGEGQGLWADSQLADQNALIGKAQDKQLDLATLLEGQFGNLTNTLEGFLDYDPNSTQNVASRDALNANVQAAFNESIRPGIEDRFTFSGQFGGPQQNNAIGAATAPLSRALASGEVDLMQGDRNRAMQAMGMAPSMYATQLIPSQIMGNIGEQRTDRSQLELADEIQQFEAPRRNQLQSLLEASGLLSPLATLEQTTKTRQKAAKGGIFQDILGYGAIAKDLGVF